MYDEQPKSYAPRILKEFRQKTYRYEIFRNSLTIPLPSAPLTNFGDFRRNFYDFPLFHSEIWSLEQMATELNKDSY